MCASVRVLYVDDDADIAEAAVTHLEDETEGVTVERAAGASEGLERLTDAVDCIVSGYDIPDRNGVAFLEAVREERPDLPFILFTDEWDGEVASEAITAGVTDHVSKRDDADQFAALAERISENVERRRAADDDLTERWLREITENATDCLWVFDRDWEELVFVSGYEEVWDRSVTALRENPQEFLTAVDEEHVDCVERAMDRLSQGETVDIEYRIQRGDGETGWVWVKGRPVFDGEGDVVRVAGFTRDVTERKQREQELEQYEAALNTVPDGVYVLDGDFRFTTVNDALTELTGYDRDELLGSHLSRVFDDEAVEKARQERDRLEEPEEFGHLETELRDSDGERVPCEVRGRFLAVADGDRDGTAGVIRDISDRKQRERDLQEQNERLDRFASVVSHDLRNPLHVASARLELAREERDGEHLDEVSSALDRMESMIDQLLTMARTGYSVDETVPVDLDTAADRAWQTTRTGDATLHVETDRVVPADPDRLQEALENLFRNAVEHGGEDVTVTIGDSPAGFFVADDGPGIPAGERDRVFESGYSESDDGLGFGLWIVRKVAEAHGWEISVTESDDGGARFEVTGVEPAGE